MTGAPERVLAARDAWLAAMAAHEAHGLEVRRPEAHRLWLEYVALATPVSARKIRKILKRGEQDAAKTIDELFPACTCAQREAAVPLGRSIPGPQVLRHAASRNQPRMASTSPRGGADQKPPI